MISEPWPEHPQLTRRSVDRCEIFPVALGVEAIYLNWRFSMKSMLCAAIGTAHWIDGRSYRPGPAKQQFCSARAIHHSLLRSWHQLASRAKQSCSRNITTRWRGKPCKWEPKGLFRASLHVDLDYLPALSSAFNEGFLLWEPICHHPCRDRSTSVVGSPLYRNTICLARLHASLLLFARNGHSLLVSIQKLDRAAAMTLFVRSSNAAHSPGDNSQRL